jgi:DNA-binding protein HU-beta
MNRSELAEKLAKETACTERDAKASVDAVIDTIQYELRAGGIVEFKGFGSFSVIEQPERQGRNPQTGEQITIPAGKRVKFKPSKALLGA